MWKTNLMDQQRTTQDATKLTTGDYLSNPSAVGRLAASYPANFTNPKQTSLFHFRSNKTTDQTIIVKRGPNPSTKPKICNVHDESSTSIIYNCTYNSTFNNFAFGIFESSSPFRYLLPFALSPVMIAEHYPEVLTQSSFDVSLPFGLVNVTSAAYYFYKQYQKASSSASSASTFVLVAATIWVTTIIGTAIGEKGQVNPMLPQHIQTYELHDFILWHGFTHCINLVTLYVASWAVKGDGKVSAKKEIIVNIPCMN